jgi:hypothetical protein
VEFCLPLHDEPYVVSEGDKFGVSETEQDELKAIVASTRGDIGHPIEEVI